MYKKSLYFLLLGLVPVVYLFDLLFTGHAFLSRSVFYTVLCGDLLAPQFDKFFGNPLTLSDPVTSAIFNEPMVFLIQESLQKGKLLFWTNDIALGSPVIGNIQVGAFFPLNWVSYLVPGSFGIDLAIFIKIAFCFLFSYFYLRRVYFSKLSSICGAVVYSFTGNVLLKANMNSLNVYVVLPFYLSMILQIHRQERGGWSEIGLGVSVALLVFSGFPQTALSAFYLGVLYHIFLVGADRKQNWKILLGRLGMGYGIGLLFSAPQLLPLLEQMQLSWAGYRSQLGTGGLEVSSLVFDLFFQEPGSNIQHPGWLGAVDLYFCIMGLGIGLWKKKRMVVFYFCIAVLYLLKAVRTPGLNEVIASFPFLNIVHFARDFSGVFFIALAVFIATAVEEIPRLSVRERGGVFIGILVFFVVLALLAAYYAPLLYPQYSGISLSKFIGESKPRMWAFGIFALSLVVQCFSVANFFKRRESILFWTVAVSILFSTFCNISRTKTQQQDFNRSHLLAFGDKIPFSGFERLAHASYRNSCPSQISALYHYNAFLNTDPLMPKRFSFFMDEMFECEGAFCISKILGVRTQSPYLPWQMAGVQYMVGLPPQWDLEKQYGQEFSQLKRIYSNSFLSMNQKRELNLYKVPGALPRAFLSNQCQIKKKFRDIYSQIKGEDKIPSFVWLDEEAGELSSEVLALCDRESVSTSFVSLTPEDYENNLVAFQVEINEPMLLVLTDLFHPSWRVFVNSVEQTVMPAFGMYRSVYLKPGKNEVKFRYSPIRVIQGCQLFVLGILLAGVCLFLHRKNKVIVCE